MSACFCVSEVPVHVQGLNGCCVCLGHCVLESPSLADGGHHRGQVCGTLQTGTLLTLRPDLELRFPVGVPVLTTLQNPITSC